MTDKEDLKLFRHYFSMGIEHGENSISGCWMKRVVSNWSLVPYEPQKNLI